MKRILFLLLLITLLSLSSCRRTCTCYTYNGNIVEFSEEELDELGLECVELESYTGGGLYSLCEKTF